MSNIADKIVAVRRRIRAPRDFIFAAWTDPMLFTQWFGPKSWSIERCEVDARKGGRWRAWFKRGDGGSVYAGGTYLEVIAPERIVFTWDLDPNGGAPDALSVVTVVFSEMPSGVEVAITHRKLGAREAIGMDVGWTNTLDALEAFVAQQHFVEGDRT